MMYHILPVGSIHCALNQMGHRWKDIGFGKTEMGRGATGTSSRSGQSSDVVHIKVVVGAGADALQPNDLWDARLRTPVVEGSASVPYLRIVARAHHLNDFLPLVLFLPLQWQFLFRSWSGFRTTSNDRTILRFCSVTTVVVDPFLVREIPIRDLSPRVDHARLIFPALWFRGAGQGDPLTLRGCNDHFPLHTPVGKDKLVQRAMVG